MKKVFIVRGNKMYSNLFNNLGYKQTDSLEDADIVCFTGGEDVSPNLYGHNKHSSTYNSIQRDMYEIDIFKICQSDNIPMVGICRGGQFLNVMSGGTMYQDVTKHCGDHSITDLETGEVVQVSSTHHQMMKPSPEAVLVASSTLGGDRVWWEGNIFKREKSEQDIEVVFYPDTKALCFQPHPEFTGPEYTGMFRYFESLLERFFVTKEQVCEC